MYSKAINFLVRRFTESKQLLIRVQSGISLMVLIKVVRGERRSQGVNGLGSKSVIFLGEKEGSLFLCKQFDGVGFIDGEAIFVLEEGKITVGK